METVGVSICSVEAPAAHYGGLAVYRTGVQGLSDPSEPQTALALAPGGETCTEAFWECAWPLGKDPALHCSGNLPAVVL